MNELQYKIEALLFSSGRKMELDELARLCRETPSTIKSSLSELREAYSQRNSSLMIIEEGASWKLAVRENFVSLVQSIVTETELTKAVMETLAVIAFKYPATLQSEVVKIRTNKAYEHLNELEEMGYLTRTKHGRTNKISLTQKFFDYFELPPKNLKENFSGFEEVAKAIEEKEAEIKAKEAEQQAQNQPQPETQPEQSGQVQDNINPPS